MEKSALRNYIKQEIREILSEDSIEEGTWSKGTPEQIQNFINDVDQIQMDYYDIVGDDEIFNGLDAAVRRAQQMMKTVDEATSAEVENQKELNKELEKTAQISKKINMDETLTTETTNTLKEFEGPMITGENELVKAIIKMGKKSKPFLKKLEKLLQDMGSGAGHALRSEAEEGEDEFDVVDKEPTKKDLKGDSVAVRGRKLQETVAQMKILVKKYKEAEGAEKEKIKERLKSLTKIKKELESSL
jgi:hypothetical protein